MPRSSFHIELKLIINGRTITILVEAPRPGVAIIETTIRLKNCKLAGCGATILQELDHPGEREYCCPEHQQKAAYLRRTHPERNGH